MNAATPCVGEWDLFDSTDPVKHSQAARLCASCPAVEWCRQEAETTAAVFQVDPRRTPLVGTWAGELYGSRVLEPLRLLNEEDMFSDEDAREAHTAWNAGDRDDRTRIGERVYQRRIVRARRARKAQESAA